MYARYTLLVYCSLLPSSMFMMSGYADIAMAANVFGIVWKAWTSRLASGWERDIPIMEWQLGTGYWHVLWEGDERGIMARKLVGIADAKDLATEKGVAKFMRNLEAVMLKNKYDNNPNMTLTCVGSIDDDDDDDDIRRQIESHNEEILAGLKRAREREKKNE